MQRTSSVCRTVAPLASKDQVGTGGITGGKALFWNVKRLDHMESFLQKRIAKETLTKAMPLPRRSTGAFSNLLRAVFCFGEGQTVELGGAGAKPALA